MWKSSHEGAGAAVSLNLRESRDVAMIFQSFYNGRKVNDASTHCQLRQIRAWDTAWPDPAMCDD